MQIKVQIEEGPNAARFLERERDLEVTI